MADRYVRSKVRGWLAAGPVPFYDTVNIDQRPGDVVWCTVLWGAPFRSKESYCNEFVEEGEVSIVFFGRPGIGDDALLADAEAAIDALMTNADPTGKLVLLDRGVGIDFRQEEHYCVEYGVPYEYRS